MSSKFYTFRVLQWNPALRPPQEYGYSLVRPPFLADRQHGLTFSCKKKTSLRSPVNTQHVKKVVSDSPGPVDFAIGLVNSVFNLPDRQVIFF